MPFSLSTLSGLILATAECKTVTPSLQGVGVDSLVELLPLVLQGQLPVDHDVDLPGGHRHTFTTSRDSAERAVQIQSFIIQDSCRSVIMPGPGRHGQLDLLQPGVEAVLAAGEPGGHGRHGDLLRLVPGEGGRQEEDL